MEQPLNHVDILSLALYHMDLKKDDTKILDCCSRDSVLATALSKHFPEVYSNDVDVTKKSQTHHNITNIDFWKYINKVYDGIITEPPSNLIEIIVLRALEHCKTFCALLLTPSKLLSINTLLMHNPASVTIFIGTELAWVIWEIDSPSRNVVIEITNEELELRDKLPNIYSEKVKEKIEFALTGHKSQIPPQHELLYLKGVHAAKQGKALERTIDKYKGMYSKRDVITKVCKMKYRSAQRKLRIAKYIEKFPEISSMTQRQAEKYISEQLKRQRS